MKITLPKAFEGFRRGNMGRKLGRYAELRVTDDESHAVYLSSFYGATESDDYVALCVHYETSTRPIRVTEHGPRSPFVVIASDEWKTFISPEQARQIHAQLSPIVGAMDLDQQVPTAWDDSRTDSEPF
jgi:hypothetical protein